MIFEKCRAKNILVAGWFHSDFLINAVCLADQCCYYRCNPEELIQSGECDIVTVDSTDLQQIAEDCCDLAIISYALLFLNRQQRLNLLSQLRRILKSGGELLLFEPVDEVQKPVQQKYLSLLKQRLNGQLKALSGAASLTNLLEEAGFQIIRRELFSGSRVADQLQLPLINMKEEPSVHLSITAINGNAENVYTLDSDADKMRPREKLLGGYLEEMKLSELLAIIIGMGNKQEDVFTMSERIIREYGSKALAGESDPKRLMEILSIGEANACKLVAAFEIGRRFYSEKVKGRQLIRGPEDVFKYAEEMSGLVKENFRGLYLNPKNYIIHDEVISIGHLTASLVHPREVFKPAIEYSAAGLIVIHNHPSGDPDPSVQDKEITEMLVAAGKTLGIPLLDHIIIGNGRYYSFNDKGQL